jgi:hypothetical protein
MGRFGLGEQEGSSQGVVSPGEHGFASRTKRFTVDKYEDSINTIGDARIYPELSIRDQSGGTVHRIPHLGSLTPAIFSPGEDALATVIRQDLDTAGTRRVSYRAAIVDLPDGRPRELRLDYPDIWAAMFSPRGWLVLARPTRIHFVDPKNAKPLRAPVQPNRVGRGFFTQFWFNNSGDRILIFRGFFHTTRRESVYYEKNAGVAFKFTFRRERTRSTPSYIFDIDKHYFIESIGWPVVDSRGKLVGLSQKMD